MPKLNCTKRITVRSEAYSIYKILYTKTLKMTFSIHGTTLVSMASVKKRFTYKELSLVLGVIVAVIIWLTIHFTNAPVSPAATGITAPTKKTSALQLILKKATSQVDRILF